MNTLELRVQEVIRVADKFGEQITKTLKKIVRVFGVCEDSIAKHFEALFGSPSLRPRPPTLVSASLLTEPLKMVIVAVLGGFILE